jgi:quercetin dioxygenase-like cupin family protein
VTVNAIVCGPGEGEPLHEDDRSIRIKAVRPELDVLEFEVTGSGYQGPGPHYHERHVDSFYVLEGWLELFVSGEPVVAGAGAYVLVPSGVVHSFTSDGARFLNVHAPETGFVDYMRALDRGEDVDPATFDVHEAEGPVAPGAAIVSPRDGGERIERRYGTLVVKAVVAPISVFELVIERPWDGVAPHVHEDHLDSFYVLEGDVDFLLGDETVHAAAGTLVAAPPGVTHGVAPVTGHARLLNLKEWVVVPVAHEAEWLALAEAALRLRAG